MEAFLRRANKPVTYVEIEDEWGDLGTVAKRKRVLDEIDRFLATSIGP